MVFKAYKEVEIHDKTNLCTNPRNPSVVLRRGMATPLASTRLQDMLINRSLDSNLHDNPHDNHREAPRAVPWCKKMEVNK